VYYDFGLTVGDTFNAAGNCWVIQGRFRVDTVSNITLLNGSTRKYFALRGIEVYNATVLLRWIEDIGHIERGFFADCDIEGGHDNLVCAYENGELLWTTSDSALPVCDPPAHVFSGFADYVTRSQPISVYPIPAQDYLVLRAGDQSISHVRYTILDLTGTTQATGSLTHGQVIQVGHLPTGFYLLALEDLDRIRSVPFVK
jgi:hypothetical protein